MCQLRQTADLCISPRRQADTLLRARSERHDERFSTALHRTRMYKLTGFWTGRRKAHPLHQASPS